MKIELFGYEIALTITSSKPSYVYPRSQAGRELAGRWEPLNKIQRRRSVREYGRANGWTIGNSLFNLRDAKLWVEAAYSDSGHGPVVTPQQSFAEAFKR